MFCDELQTSLAMRSLRLVKATSGKAMAELATPGAPAYTGGAGGSSSSFKTRPSRFQAHLAEEVVEGPVRFHLVPKIGWDDSVRAMQCGARNYLKKIGEDWLLPPQEGTSSSSSSPSRAPWLLPASDDVAVQLAQRQAHLRKLGWRLITSDPDVVIRLGNKAKLRDFAEQSGLLDYLPTHFSTASTATFPCILKSATGEFGKENSIVSTPSEVDEVAGGSLSSQWVLQELVAGKRELSVSLLVQRGALLEVVGTSYECGREIFVWPNVRNVKMAPYEPSEAELEVMRLFLKDYNGICNFNYKLRPDGRMCIFEINTRIGGDLACDVPREAARRLFERLDSLTADSPELGGVRPVADGETEWDEPLVVEPADGRHRYTLVYLHPFRIGLRDYVRKMGLFSRPGLRLVFPHAPRRKITCFGGKEHKAWYDYLSDNNGAGEDQADPASLADSRRYLLSLLNRERELLRAALVSEEGEEEEEKEELEELEEEERGRRRDEAGRRIAMAGCSQGCAMALDVAMHSEFELRAFCGILGHPLTGTPMNCQLGVPLHFFNGANDKVMRWQWVKPMIDKLGENGHRTVVHGPLKGVHHSMQREFEAKCLHEFLDELDQTAANE